MCGATKSPFVNVSESAATNGKDRSLQFRGREGDMHYVLGEADVARKKCWPTGTLVKESAGRKRDSLPQGLHAESDLEGKGEVCRPTEALVSESAAREGKLCGVHIRRNIDKLKFRLEKNSESFEQGRLQGIHGRGDFEGKRSRTDADTENVDQGRQVRQDRGGAWGKTVLRMFGQICAPLQSEDKEQRQAVHAECLLRRVNGVGRVDQEHGGSQWDCATQGKEDARQNHSHLVESVRARTHECAQSCTTECVLLKTDIKDGHEDAQSKTDTCVHYEQHNVEEMAGQEQGYERLEDVLQRTARKDPRLSRSSHAKEEEQPCNLGGLTPHQSLTDMMRTHLSRTGEAQNRRNPSLSLYQSHTRAIHTHTTQVDENGCRHLSPSPWPSNRTGTIHTHPIHTDDYGLHNALSPPLTAPSPRDTSHKLSDNAPVQSKSTSKKREHRTPFPVRSWDTLPLSPASSSSLKGTVCKECLVVHTSTHSTCVQTENRSPSHRQNRSPSLIPVALCHLFNPSASTSFQHRDFFSSSLPPPPSLGRPSSAFCNCVDSDNLSSASHTSASHPPSCAGRLSSAYSNCIQGHDLFCASLAPAPAPSPASRMHAHKTITEGDDMFSSSPPPSSRLPTSSSAYASYCIPKDELSCASRAPALSHTSQTHSCKASHETDDLFSPSLPPLPSLVRTPPSLNTGCIQADTLSSPLPSHDPSSHKSLTSRTQAYKSSLERGSIFTSSLPPPPSLVQRAPALTYTYTMPAPLPPPPCLSSLR